MKNTVKSLLSSAILTASAFASTPVVDLKDNLVNSGTINIYPNSVIRVEEGKWIENYGEIKFIRETNDQTFTIQGTNADNEDSSGIKNYRTGFVKIEKGLPGNNEHMDVENVMYYRFKELGGKCVVVANGDDEVSLTPNDYIKSDGGTILDLDGTIYDFLRKNDGVNNKNSNVVVLRFDENYGDDIRLSHRFEGLDQTTAEAPLVINTPFANSAAFESFVDADDVEAVPLSLPKSFPLRVVGFYKFVADNSEFTEGSVFYDEGEVQIASSKAMFPVKETTVIGAKLNIDLSQDDDKTLNFANTLTVFPEGCFCIAAGTKVVIKQGGRLELGVSDD